MTRAVLALPFVVAWLCGVAAADGQSFEVASVKPATSGGTISCSGGPGTADPTLWRCSNMPLALLISKAFRFQDYQFSTHDPCCLARFDFIARVRAGTTNDQFDRMLQSLLKERFKLAFHYQQKEMPIYELTVAANGPKMKQTAPGTPRESEPWWVLSGSMTGLDKDGYPVFSEGDSGLANSAGHCRWTAFNVSTADIAETLSDQSNRPVVNATGLKGAYDVDLKWVVDLNFTLSESVQDQLGLRLNSTKGPGEIVVVDHLEKVPTGN